MSVRRDPHEALNNIIDIREYDIPYYLRTVIDNGTTECTTLYMFGRYLMSYSVRAN